MFRIWQVAVGSNGVGKTARGGAYTHVAFFVLSTWHCLSHLVGSEADSSSIEITGGFIVDFDT